MSSFDLSVDDQASYRSSFGILRLSCEKAQKDYRIGTQNVRKRFATGLANKRRNHCNKLDCNTEQYSKAELRSDPQSSFGRFQDSVLCKILSNHLYDCLTV